MTTVPAPQNPRNQISIPTTLLSLISYETSSILASDGQFEGVKVSGCVIDPKATETDIRAALRAVNEQCRPCGGDFATKQLARLRALTKMRADQDGQLLVFAYADMLADFPADVVRDACTEWAKGNPFFPAWSDLQRICDRLCSQRIALRKALAAALEPKPAALYLGKPAPETREDRLRAIRDAYARIGNSHKSAKVERELAAAEGREPEEWARDMPDDEPRAAPAEAPPFEPKNDAKTQRMRELAAKWRAEEEAKRKGSDEEAA